MKLNKIIRSGFVLMTCILLSTGCGKQFLDEKPLDFYTPNNALQTKSDFQSSVNNLYNRFRSILIGGINLDANFALRYATDFAVNATDYNPPVKLNDYKNTMVPEFFVVSEIWNDFYKIILNANVIIDRAKISSQLSEEDKAEFTGEALFFRAVSYNILADLYGGVPLILNEVKEPRRDYVRASREDVYKQCASDLEQAADFLKNVDEVESGKANKQAAQHVLTEVYISLGNLDMAISTASKVIDYPGLGIMTERFGRHANDPGDVYRDLFELNNQSRSSGNKEGIFVIKTTFQNKASLRDFTQWAMIPDMANLRVQAKAADGSIQTFPAIMGYNDKWSGRGVGWMRPTSHFLYEIWGENDIRNSQYNIIRDFRMDGLPANSPDFGKWYVKDGFAAKTNYFGDTIRNWFPIIKKVTLSEGDFPSDYYKIGPDGKPEKSPLGGTILTNDSENSFKDSYFIRLAETYLLRAEAYIKKGEKQKAADDINVLRARAHASLASAGEMDIDYLLDERLRELYGEELRMVTLTRMGKLYDRDVKYNEKSGKSIQPYHNLWPIPFSEIERNTGAELKQNPGYSE